MFAQTGWQPICEEYDLGGLNITSLAAEYSKQDKICWVKQDIPGADVEYRRPASRAIKTRNGTLRVTIHGAPNMKCSLRLDLRDMVEWKLLSLSVEIMETGPHAAPFCRLTLVRGYDD